MLTQKQQDLLLFINERLSEGDISPSFEEMKDALGLKSKSGIHRLISALVERGYLKRLPNRARALEIIRLPESIKEKTDSLKVVPFTAAPFLDIPLHGRIAAGTAIEAIRDETATISIPNTFVGRGEHYALTVDGDSMILAGIHDGDTVIIKRTEHANDGDIIVALVDDTEVTLKRLRRAGNKIVLEPENTAYEPLILEPHRVKIQGKLASLMRTYH